jgi:hypothetical protein
MDVGSLDPKGYEAMDGWILIEKARTSNNSFNSTRVKSSKKSSSIEYNYELSFCSASWRPIHLYESLL